MDTTTTIQSFLDFFTDDYSSVCLIVGVSIIGVIWLLCCCYSCKAGNILPVFSLIEIFFDVTSAAANWAAGEHANKVHAVGSLWHGCGAAFRLAGPGGLEDLSRPSDDLPSDDAALLKSPDAALVSSFWFSLPGCILELGAIASTINGWKEIMIYVVIAIGAVLAVMIGTVCASDGNNVSGKAFSTAVGVVLQLTYYVVVLIAATDDWSRLLWILPEFPLETITLCISGAS